LKIYSNVTADPDGVHIVRFLEEFRDAGWFEKSISIHTDENICLGDAGSKREERHHETEEVWRVNHCWSSCPDVEVVEKGPDEDEAITFAPISLLDDAKVWDSSISSGLNHQVHLGMIPSCVSR
jgi:hypothetical protein